MRKKKLHDRWKKYRKWDEKEKTNVKTKIVKKKKKTLFKTIKKIKRQ